MLLKHILSHFQGETLIVARLLKTMLYTYNSEIVPLIPVRSGTDVSRLLSKYLLVKR